ncbi:MAG: HxsD-like protein [Polyangiaceae bacterium]
MILVALKKELYGEAAVSAAVDVFREHADLARRDSDSEWRIEVTASQDERLIADELANYALGLTIEGRGDALSGV